MLAMTQWVSKEIAVMPENYKKLMRTSLVYIGRNICDTQKMKEAQVEYYSIGR